MIERQKRNKQVARFEPAIGDLLQSIPNYLRV
jgi:hypothetical protein